MEALMHTTLVVLPEEEWKQMKQAHQEILGLVRDLNNRGLGSIPVRNITAKEFMAAVRIGRTKFDQLVMGSKIRIIKKRRKIYVPISEVERYFNDASIL
jgi:hypothetical protein